MTEEKKDLTVLLQNTGDSVAYLFEQLTKGSWVDDNGHDVRLNMAMLGMQKVLIDIMEFRTKYLDYEKVT